MTLYINPAPQSHGSGRIVRYLRTLAVSLAKASGVRAGYSLPRSLARVPGKYSSTEAQKDRPPGTFTFDVRGIGSSRQRGRQPSERCNNEMNFRKNLEIAADG